MKALFTEIFKDTACEKLGAQFKNKKGSTLVYGLSGAQKHAVFAAAFAEKPRPLAIITRTQEGIQAWQENLAALIPEIPVHVLPEIDAAEVDAKAKGMERAIQRMDILVKLARKEPMIVLATAAASAVKGMSKAEFDRKSLQLRVGEQVARDTLLTNLLNLGYTRSDEVEHIGEFSARGGIVDVFPINRVRPVRIEFFDEDVDSLREYDFETKRSIQNIQSLSILPAMESTRGDKQKECFLSYLAAEGAVLFDDPMRIREQLLALGKENPEARNNLFAWEEILTAARAYNVFFFALMLQPIHGQEPDAILHLTATSMTPFQRQMDLFADEAVRWLEAKTTVLVLIGEKSKADQLREFFARRRISSAVLTEGMKVEVRRVNILVGTLRGGFELPGAHLAVVTEEDIFGRQKKRSLRRAQNGEKIKHFREIKPGDYVVHSSHGVGKYLGVETIETGGIHRDYLHIKYRGEDKLFIPTDQVQFLQKYIGSEGQVPKLSNLSTGDWARTKAKAQKAVEDIADKLLELYAARKTAKGYAYAPDDSSQQEFEDAFPYVETEDQLRAIREIKEDMEREKPMDRLLCGDVGFGKTEVAIRAAYKAVMDGKQVAVLVPTTVLAQQHYQTFSARCLDFLPKVDVICRFRTAKEQKETLEKVERGAVDILIGTHAILNQKRVVFKDLGLLIVDEEQRFGVKQKEKIKKLAAGIDVLTLSATPIPRTLHMSLVGARDMSIIETAPAERFPVQTYVVENNDAVIAGAIKREMKRGGQIYFIYNRVASMERMKERLQTLVPDARIQIAHGQMSEALLERVMMDFYEGAYDILLATTIVENGLDVANANTIIVDSADHFGLSQLYQMRGRVGRSHHMAFAYFVYQADKVISETAEKRLQAMKDFAQLGAGFKIAMRDLEIRGAGNLLGAQQHGHIASVGFEMYCQLLEDAVENRKHGQQAEKKESPVEPVVDISIEAYIDGYIEDAMHKMELYQRIAAIRKNEEIREFIDELIDRFGEPSACVMNLLAVARIRNYARKMRMQSILEKDMRLEITFAPNPKVAPERIVKLKERLGSAVQLLPQDNILRIRLNEVYKKKIANFITRILMYLDGDDAALMAKRKGKA